MTLRRRGRRSASSRSGSTSSCGGRREVRSAACGGLVLLVVALGLVAAGCGGGGGNDEASKPLTKAQYQTKLQQLSNDVGAELRQSIGASTTLKQSDVPKLQQSLRSFAGKLDALNPPADGRRSAHAAGRGDARLRRRPARRSSTTLDRRRIPSAAIAALFGAKPIEALIQLQQAFKDKGYDISSLLDAGSGP